MNTDNLFIICGFMLGIICGLLIPDILTGIFVYFLVSIMFWLACGSDFDIEANKE